MNFPEYVLKIKIVSVSTDQGKIPMQKRLLLAKLIQRWDHCESEYYLQWLYMYWNENVITVNICPFIIF